MTYHKFSLRKAIIYILLLVSFRPIFSDECHSNLSYSRQTIQTLPMFVIEEITPIDRIIFLHIPKTAGTNLANFAKIVSCKDGKFHYQRLSVPRVQGRSPNLITPDWIGGLQQLENNPNLLDAISQNFFISGHFPYGLHEYFSRPCKYVTLIRHPLERELSDANFAYQRGYINEEKFEYYLKEQMIDNPQVRLIAGREYMMGPCSESVLAKAKENIEHEFLLAAPTDDADVFFQLLATIQKWGNLAYAPMQVTGKKVAKNPNSDLLSTLLEKHKWDLKLYEWVKMRWNLFKEKMILGVKELESEEKLLTLMPDYLTTREASFLSVHEIDEYNYQHTAGDLLELKQLPSKVGVQ